MSISVHELLHLTLLHPSSQKQLSQYNLNMDKYLKIILTNKIGDEIQISNYTEYLNEIPKLLPKFKPHISSYEYNTLLLFKHIINGLVSEMFKDLCD